MDAKDLPVLDQIFDRHEQAPEFVGKDRREAELAARESGINLVRVIDLDAVTEPMITFDLRRNRLNLAILDQHVVRAAFF